MSEKPAYERNILWHKNIPMCSCMNKLTAFWVDSISNTLWNQLKSHYSKSAETLLVFKVQGQLTPLLTFNQQSISLIPVLSHITHMVPPVKEKKKKEKKKDLFYLFFLCNIRFYTLQTNTVKHCLQCALFYCLACLNNILTALFSIGKVNRALSKLSRFLQKYTNPIP